METVKSKKSLESKMEKGKSQIDIKLICHEILYFLDFGFEEMTSEEKRKMLKCIDRVMWKWVRKHSEYYDLAGDGEEWDELECMDFVLLDLFKVWYDRLAKELGEECYDEKERKLEEERRLKAEEASKLSPGDEVKKNEDSDDGLPF